MLEHIFAGKAEHDQILVWRMPGKLSTWHGDTRDITINHQVNMYFGLGTVSEETAHVLGQWKRTSADVVTGIGALWIDADIAGPAHKKANLPADAETARTLIAEAFAPLEPGYVVHSGHGLQAYFLLDEWLTIDAANRTGTKALLQAFSDHWRAVNASKGFDADSVHDLARVMRLPGSINCKLIGDPRPVEIIETGDARYNLRKISEVVSTEPTIIVLPPVPPPTEPVDITTKWEALRETDQRIADSFDHDRRDMADQSPSAYDMSLARFAARADWTQSEIETLLRLCRRSHSLEIKPHAIRLTAAKAIEETKRERAPGATTDKLSEYLGIPITRFIRYDTTPPAYILISDKTKIDLGTIEGITEQKRFRNSIAAGAGILPAKLKPDLWDKVVSAILAACEHDSAGTAATEIGQTIEQLQAYLHSVPVHSNRNDGLTAGEPWAENGAVHIIGTAWRAWLSVHLQERLPARELALRLKAIGAEPCTVTHTANGMSVERSCWRVPADVRSG